MNPERLSQPHVRRPAARYRPAWRTQVERVTPVYSPGDVVMQGMEFFVMQADGKFVPAKHIPLLKLLEMLPVPEGKVVAIKDGRKG